MVKLKFNKTKVQEQNSRPKYILKKKQATIKTMGPKLLNLPRKGPKNPRSPSFGKYPVPTGRILERYAYKHDLAPVLPVAKKILSNPKIIGEDMAIKNIKAKKNLTYHEAVKVYKNICPCKDSDGDGVVNMADCRPFNKNKQDVEYEIYDKHGHIKPPKEEFVKDTSGYIPITKPLNTIQVETKPKKIETIQSRKSK